MGSDPIDTIFPESGDGEDLGFESRRRYTSHLAFLKGLKLSNQETERDVREISKLHDEDPILEIANNVEKIHNFFMEPIRFISESELADAGDELGISQDDLLDYLKAMIRAGLIRPIIENGNIVYRKVHNGRIVS